MNPKQQNKSWIHNLCRTLGEELFISCRSDRVSCSTTTATGCKWVLIWVWLKVWLKTAVSSAGAFLPLIFTGRRRGQSYIPAHIYTCTHLPHPGMASLRWVWAAWFKNRNLWKNVGWSLGTTSCTRRNERITITLSNQISFPWIIASMETTFLQSVSAPRQLLAAAVAAAQEAHQLRREMRS